MYRWAFVREGEEVKYILYYNCTITLLYLTYLTSLYCKVGNNSVGVGGGGPPQADFVPHIARYVLAVVVLCLV